MAVSEQHLTTLREQLGLHRATLQQLWEQKATHEQAIVALKATLQVSGVAYDISPYDGTGSSAPSPLLDQEVQRAVECALGGPAAIASRRFT